MTQPSSLEDQARFGARLRMQREARGQSISDVVKVTKIPERSLLLLESGAFKDLPAEVFVRGFLKSYCRCVGLDVDQILREYAELVASAEPGRREPPPLSRPSSRGDQGGAEAPRRTTGSQAQVAATAAAADRPAGEAAGEPPAAAQPEAKEEPSVFDALARAGRSTSRASLTVAVIILVIVATLTLSLLLRRPGHVGNGVSSLTPSGVPGVAPALRAG